MWPWASGLSRRPKVIPVARKVLLCVCVFGFVSPAPRPAPRALAGPARARGRRGAAAGGRPGESLFEPKRPRRGGRRRRCRRRRPRRRRRQRRRRQPRRRWRQSAVFFWARFFRGLGWGGSGKSPPGLPSGPPRAFAPGVCPPGGRGFPRTRKPLPPSEQFNDLLRSERPRVFAPGPRAHPGSRPPGRGEPRVFAPGPRTCPGSRPPGRARAQSARA